MASAYSLTLELDAAQQVLRLRAAQRVFGQPQHVPGVVQGFVEPAELLLAQARWLITSAWPGASSSDRVNRPVRQVVLLALEGFVHLCLKRAASAFAWPAGPGSPSACWGTSPTSRRVRV